MTTVRYFWHTFIHRGTTFMYLQYSRPLIYHFLPNIWKASYTISGWIFVEVPYWRISSPLVLYWVPRGVSFTLANRLQSHGLRTTLGGTEPHHSSWQCKESHRCCCHRPLASLEMGDSGTSTVLTRYVIRPTISSPNWKNHCEGPDTAQEMNLFMLWGGQYGTSTKMDTLMVCGAFQTFGKRW